jgi:hypothetical protein
MVAFTLTDVCPYYCPIWPCKVNGIASIIIILAGVVYLLERLKAYRSNK